MGVKLGLTMQFIPRMKSWLAAWAVYGLFAQAPAQADFSIEDWRAGFESCASDVPAPAVAGPVRMTAAGGGQAFHPAGHRLQVPPLAAAGDFEASIDIAMNDPADRWIRERSMQDARLRPASEPVEFQPDGAKFATPVTITLVYSPQVDPQKEPDLTIAHWNPASLRWEPLRAEVDRENGVVRAEVEHLSLYQAVVPKEDMLPLADPAFILGEVSVNPNPALEGQSPMVHVECGLADGVSLWIYNEEGELLKRAALSGIPEVIGGRYAYRYVWDPEDSPAGSYLLKIEAEKEGKKPLKARKRIRLLR